MPANLKTVSDHPSELLIALRDSGKTWTLATDIKFGIEGAARHLRSYEKEHDVTFAALDTETLDAIHEFYAKGDMYEVGIAVAALLGLDD